MKALIRDDEILTDQMRTDYINWVDGTPLTNPDWAGGPYTLVKDYVPLIEESKQEQTDILTPYGKRIAEIADLKARLAALEKEV